MERKNYRRGYRCPRCDEDVEIVKDKATKTYAWVCPNDCLAMGVGFKTRRSARVGLRKYREEFGSRHREYR